LLGGCPTLLLERSPPQLNQDATLTPAPRSQPASTATISGTQNPDGAVERFIVAGVLHPDTPITLHQAAKLGLALLEVVNEAQKMAKLDLQQAAMSDTEGTIEP
jgi:hypothetical protein